MEQVPKICSFSSHLSFGSMDAWIDDPSNLASRQVKKRDFCCAVLRLSTIGPHDGVMFGPPGYQVGHVTKNKYELSH